MLVLYKMFCSGRFGKESSLQKVRQNVWKEIKTTVAWIVKTELLHTFGQVKMNHLLVHWRHWIDSDNFLRPFQVIALIHHLITAQELGMMGHSSHVPLPQQPCIRQGWRRISPPRYPFIFPSFFFNFSSCHSSISPLTPQLFLVLGGQLSFNSPVSPLWLWVNVHCCWNWQREEVSWLRPTSLDICGTAEWQNMWVCTSACLMFRHGLEIVSQEGSLS